MARVTAKAVTFAFGQMSLGDSLRLDDTEIAGRMIQLQSQCIAALLEGDDALRSASAEHIMKLGSTAELAVGDAPWENV